MHLKGFETENKMKHLIIVTDPIRMLERKVAIFPHFFKHCVLETPFHEGVFCSLPFTKNLIPFPALQQGFAYNRGSDVHRFLTV